MATEKVGIYRKYHGVVPVNALGVCIARPTMSALTTPSRGTASLGASRMRTKFAKAHCAGKCITPLDLDLNGVQTSRCILRFGIRLHDGLALSWARLQRLIDDHPKLLIDRQNCSIGLRSPRQRKRLRLLWWGMTFGCVKRPTSETLSNSEARRDLSKWFE